MSNFPTPPGAAPVYLRALYPFDGEKKDKLVIQPNDIILRIRDYGNGWTRGRRISDNKEGDFPTSYVEIYNFPAAAAPSPPIPVPAPAPAPAPAQVAQPQVFSRPPPPGIPMFPPPPQQLPGALNKPAPPSLPPGLKPPFPGAGLPPPPGFPAQSPSPQLPPPGVKPPFPGFAAPPSPPQLPTGPKPTLSGMPPPQFPLPQRMPPAPAGGFAPPQLPPQPQPQPPPPAAAAAAVAAAVAKPAPPPVPAASSKPNFAPVAPAPSPAAANPALPPMPTAASALPPTPSALPPPPGLGAATLLPPPPPSALPPPPSALPSALPPPPASALPPPPADANVGLTPTSRQKSGTIFKPMFSAYAANYDALPQPPAVPANKPSSNNNKPAWERKIPSVDERNEAYAEYYEDEEYDEHDPYFYDINGCYKMPMDGIYIEYPIVGWKRGERENYNDPHVAYFHGLHLADQMNNAAISTSAEADNRNSNGSHDKRASIRVSSSASANRLSDKVDSGKATETGHAAVRTNKQINHPSLNVDLSKVGTDQRLKNETLWKRNDGVIKSWKQVTCQLFKDELQFYEPDNARKQIGSVPITDDTTVEEQTDKKQEFCFSVTRAGKSTFLAADTEESRDLWMAMLEKVIQYWKDNQDM